MSLHLIYLDQNPPSFRGTGPDFPAHDLDSIDDAQVKAILLRFGISTLLSDPKPAPVMWWKFKEGKK